MKKTLYKVSVLAAATLVAAACFSTFLDAQTQIRTAKQMPFPKNPDWARLELETLHVQGQVYLIAGAGANIAVQMGAGDDGTMLMVDTGYAQMGDKVLAAIRQLGAVAKGKPGYIEGGSANYKVLRTIINTTFMDSSTGSNAKFVQAGSTGVNKRGNQNEADVIAHGNTLLLMTEIGRDKIPVDRWPASTFSVGRKDIYANNESIVLLHVKNGVTAGDTMVHFRTSDVVASGPLFNQASFPRIDVEHGGSIEGILEGLNMLLDITVPKFNQEGGTMVIPGYGRISDEHDVSEYRDMVGIISDRIKKAIQKGMTLQQVKALKPSVTYEYESRFDRDPDWTAEMFVDAAYRSHSAAKRPAAR